MVCLKPTKKTDSGKTIHTCLFPPVVVNEGDEMVDADLFDLEGKIHHLADYKGKYMLVDIGVRDVDLASWHYPK